MNLRFVMKPVDRETIIVDTGWKNRVVATCQEAEEAIAILAFLNGHSEIGGPLHAAFLRRLALRGP